MNEHEKINYVEFPAKDIEKAKAFFSTVFGWSFVDYGPEYTSFNDGRLDGGFRKEASVGRGGPLIVIYSTNLELIKTESCPCGAVMTIYRRILRAAI